MIDGHGDDFFRYEKPIRTNFSSNLTDWIDPTPLLGHLCTHIAEAVTTYPEPQAYTVEARLAKTLGIRPAEVCVCSGATSAIYLIAQSYPQQCSHILQPTFSEYADACRIHGHRVASLYRMPMGGDLPQEVRMIWMCNPNNPTGTAVDKDYLLWLIDTRPDVLFVIDQSYEAFTQKRLLMPHEVVSRSNVVTLHSLTKRYGIPGLRIGYVLAHEDVIRHLRTHYMPWPCNGLALQAALCLAERPDLVPFDLAGCLRETARLRTALQATRVVDVWDTDTHFMLCHLRTGRAAALKEYLAATHGILIRDASNFEGLDNSFFRVSTQLPDENDRLVEAVQQFLTAEL